MKAQILVIAVITVAAVLLSITLMRAKAENESEFNAYKILHEMLKFEKGNKQKPLVRFSTAVFPISFEAAFRTAMLVEMSLGRVPVTVDKVGGILTTSDSPQKMLSGSTFVSYYFEPLGKDKTRVYIRTKVFYFSSGSGWDIDDELSGALQHINTVILYVFAAQLKDLEVKEIVKQLSNPDDVIKTLKTKFDL